jgi:exosortase
MCLGGVDAVPKFQEPGGQRNAPRDAWLAPAMGLGRMNLKMDPLETSPVAAVQRSGREDLSLRDELMRLWAALPGRGLFVALFLAWVAVFLFLGNATFGYVDTASLFGWTINAYRSGGEDDIGLFVPFVVLGLLWWKREELGAVRKEASTLGGLVFFCGALLHVAGYVFQQPKISILAFMVGIYGIMGMLWGRRWMAAVAFPFWLLLFCLPLGQQGEVLTVPLRMLVSKLSVGFCHAVLGIDVMREGSLIFNGHRTFQYDVAPACSGIRSLTALGFIIAVFAFVQYRSWWKRGVLLAVVVPLAVAGNTARIVMVIIAGEMKGQAAGAAIEQKLGFLTFLVALGGALGIGWIMDRRSRRKPLPVGDSQSRSGVQEGQA